MRLNIKAILAAGALLAGGLAVWFVFGSTAPVVERPIEANPANAQPKLFREAAREAGLAFRMMFLPGEQGEKFKTNLYDHGSGVAVADYNGDGHDDIYFLNQLGTNGLFKNRGDGTFSDVTAEAGVGLGDRVCVAACFADYDNDGDQDLFVTSTRAGNVLFRNDGKGAFEDVTESAGVSYVGHSQSPLFFDFDNDGWLDLFVTNTAKWTLDAFVANGGYYPGTENLAIYDKAVHERERNILYRNAGNGTFTDVTESTGVGGERWNNDAAFFDYDDDGQVDLLVTNMFGHCPLYRNIGAGHFEDVTASTLGKTPMGGMGAKVFDFDNDGKLDVLIVDMHSDMWMQGDLSTEPMARRFEKSKLGLFPLVGLAGRRGQINDIHDSRVEEIARKVALEWDLALSEVVFGNALFKNLGNGKFEDVTESASMETFWPWGAATGDFDNDGFEDVFIASGMGYPFFYWPNQLMMNQVGKRFINRIRDYGLDPPADGIYLDQDLGGRKCTRSSRAAAVADFDGDGRLEIVTNNFNDAPYFYKNEFPQKNFIAFQLQGTRSNRDAIGAVVRVHAGNEIMTRQLSSAGGDLTQSSKTLHFGLGDRTAVDFVEIQWPGGSALGLTIPS